MEIIPYNPDFQAALTDLYNQATVGVPHCYPVCVEAFADSLPKEASQRDLHNEIVLVVREGSSILGFIHGGITRDEQEPEGILRFLWYAPGQRSVGQQLLDAAENHFRQHNISRIIASPQEYRYPFYHLDHAYLSDHLGHVQALLQFDGYRKCAGEVYFDWPDYQPEVRPLVDANVEVTIKEEPGDGVLPGVVAKLHQGGEQIGVCKCVSCGEFSDSQEVQDWCFVEWLGIGDEAQGKGLGRYLLQRTLQEAWHIGYRHTSISTDWQNYRAFVFYSNYGYHVVDWTYAFMKDIAR